MERKTLLETLLETLLGVLVAFNRTRHCNSEFGEYLDDVSQYYNGRKVILHYGIIVGCYCVIRKE